jgi:NAD(P)H-flavin reductase
MTCQVIFVKKPYSALLVAPAGDESQHKISEAGGSSTELVHGRNPGDTVATAGPVQHAVLIQ